MAKLVDALQPEASRDRRAAIERLPAEAEATSEELREFVRRGLGDADFGVRWASASWLRRAAPGRDEIVGIVAESIEAESEPQRRASAMETLGQLGEVAVPPLEALAASSNPGVRRLAVDALGNTRAPSAEARLRIASGDVNPAVRASAVEALSKIGGPGCSAAVREVLDRDGEAASVSLAALLAIEAEGVPLETQMLARHAEHPVTAGVALRLLGRAGVLEPLVANLVSVRRSRRHAALDGLYEALDGHPEVRARARELIPTDDVRKLCVDPDVMVVARAAVVLARCGDLTGIVALVDHPNGARELARAHVAAQAARLLGVAAVTFGEAREAVRTPDGLRLFDEATEKRGIPGDVGLSALGDELFAALRDRISNVTGLFFEPHAAERLASRLRPVARGFGHTSWNQFIEALSDEVILRAAIERVTVHETYFFREDRQLAAFSELFLPSLPLGERRVWSAGCATGEEAWTLAILLEEQGGLARWSVEGTDISPGVVEEARRGVYGRRSFRGMTPAELKERYFEKHERGLRVVDRLRDRVQFRVDNLVEDDEAQRGFDAVFCRNVLIYLSPEARTKVIARFFRALRPGGMLFLGHSESLLHTDNPFEIVVLEREIVYRKPEAIA